MADTLICITNEFSNIDFSGVLDTILQEATFCIAAAVAGMAHLGAYCIMGTVVEHAVRTKHASLGQQILNTYIIVSASCRAVKST